MGNDEKFALLNGFNRLSGEKQAEILGMAKAFTFVQLGEDERAPAFVNKDIYSAETVCYTKTDV